jgi:hypothetical protein
MIVIPAKAHARQLSDFATALRSTGGGKASRPERARYNSPGSAKRHPGFGGQSNNIYALKGLHNRNSRTPRALRPENPASTESEELKENQVSYNDHLVPKTLL